MKTRLRFHWRLPLGGEKPGEARSANPDPQVISLPAIEEQSGFCQLAEEHEIDSLLTAFGYYMPDPMLLAAVLGGTTRRINFIVAYRPGLLAPALFVQQVNTLSFLTNGRISLNIVIGHSSQEQKYYGDFLNHDDRYERAEEFLAICHAFWKRNGSVNFSGKYFKVEEGRINVPFFSPDRSIPEIYLGGGSPPAQALASKHASCLLLLGDTPENLRACVQRALDQGIDAGLRFSIISRRTRKEAVEAAFAMIDAASTQWVDKTFVRGTDSVSMQAVIARAKDPEATWPRSYLWNGAVPTHGISAISLVGSPEEIAGAVMEYTEIGVSQFIFSGWPNTDALIHFGEEVLPLIREREARQ